MNLVYKTFISAYVNQKVNLDTDNIKISLLTDAYIPDLNNDSNFSTVKNYEIIAPNYEAKKVSLTRYNEMNNKVFYTCSTVEWRDVSFTTRYAVLYRVEDGLLVSLYDFGSNQKVNDGVFTLDWRGGAALTLALSDGSIDPSFFIDSELSNISTNALENRVTTENIGKFGVILGNDTEVPDPLKDNLDAIKDVSSSSIDSLFD